MTFYSDNATFASNAAQALVNRGLGFTFYKSPGNGHGEFAFHVMDDKAIDLIRYMGDHWAVSLYEVHDKDQPNRD
jgi:hypothetical protein